MVNLIQDEVIKRIRALGNTVLRHSEWGTRYESLYQLRLATKPVELPVDYMFQHISVTRDEGPLKGHFIDDMQELERIGYERFGSGISYNWVVDPVTGMIGEGQYLRAKGTHTVNDYNVPGFPDNLNYFGHAICAIGMSGVRPTAKFVYACASILRAEWDAGAMENRTDRYFPHSKFANKECPTEAIKSLMPAITQTAIQLGAVMSGEITFSTPLPGNVKDPDGTLVNVGEALARGNYAYWARDPEELAKFIEANKR